MSLRATCRETCHPRNAFVDRNGENASPSGSTGTLTVITRLTHPIDRHGEVGIRSVWHRPLSRTGANPTACFISPYEVRPTSLDEISLFEDFDISRLPPWTNQGRAAGALSREYSPTARLRVETSIEPLNNAAYIPSDARQSGFTRPTHHTPPPRPFSDTEGSPWPPPRAAPAPFGSRRWPRPLAGISPFTKRVLRRPLPPAWVYLPR